MIAKPTTPQLLEVVCTELMEKVAPTIDEPTVRVVIEMAVSVLKTAVVRSANELAWMREEAAAIDAVASAFVSELTDVGPLTAALDAYRKAKTDSLYLADVQRDYELASEVLSCAIEAAYADGDTARLTAVRHLMDQRMTNERSVTGAFVAAGRD